MVQIMIENYSECSINKRVTAAAAVITSNQCVAVCVIMIPVCMECCSNEYQQVLPFVLLLSYTVK